MARRFSRPAVASDRRGNLSPEFFSEAVAIGEVHGQDFFEMLEQLGRLVSVEAVAFQCCHKVALIGYLAPSLREVSLGGR